MVKISDYIISFIADLGVKHIFMLPGGQAMHLIDSIGRCEKTTHICALHEQAAAMMCVAYSRVTGNFGAAVVTSGPGGTNAVTGVASAWLDSIPCMFISGQFRTETLAWRKHVRQTCIQGLDPVEIVESLTKYAVLIGDPYMTRYHLEKAVYLAKTGRPGPVWLDVPLDVQSAVVEEKDLVSFDPGEPAAPPDYQLLEKQARECIQLLSKAARPVLLAGNGIRLAHAVADFRKLAVRLGIPVLTSVNGMDLIDHRHPLYIGRPNYWGQRAANFVIQNADLLLSIGCGLDLSLTGFNYQAFAREAIKIIVDIDPGELKKPNAKPDVPVNCDAGDFIRELMKHLDGFSNEQIPKWLNLCKSWKEEYPIVLEEYRQRKGYVDLYVFIDTLSDELAPTDIVIPGNAGSHFECAAQAFKVKEGQRVISHVGIGAMGHSLPSSIGACIGSGGRRTICLTGDGGIQLNIQELQTVVNYSLPVKIFVFKAFCAVSFF
ncbi:MAG: thiamine pyrophosphate-binding protein [Bacillota bacterium]|nr:thiamine pyrophosphate-binding protein [Bacillota bacterium]